MQLVLQNARVIDPHNGVDEKKDIALSDGIIVDPLEISKDHHTKFLDVTNYLIVPGLIDIHVHLREPGFEYKEDIQSGTKAAAAGGFTTIVAMPNTQPPIDSTKAIHDLKARIREKSLIRTLITGCLSKNRKGEKLSEILTSNAFSDLIALSDDGDCIQDLTIMTRVAEIAKKAGLPIVDHCEDNTLSANAFMREGTLSKLLEIPGMKGEAESNMVARNIELSKKTGVKIHIQHISYIRSVELVRQAQKDGLPITAEASPHHLALTNVISSIAGTNSKMNPPLGTEEDRQAILEALRDGTINTIATDHAPHSPAEKAKGFVDAPFGIIGLETALPICITELYEKKYLTLSELVSKFTTGPAEVLNLDAGTLSLGAKADVTIVDLNTNYSLDINNSFSKSRNSPFHNKRVRGKVVGTLCRGNWVFRDNNFPV